MTQDIMDLKTLAAERFDLVRLRSWTLLGL
jgi:hypothetical protein